MEGTIELSSNYDPPLNDKTVQTILSIVENKKIVSHSLSGLAFVYRPRVKRNEVSGISLRSLRKRYFLGSRSELLDYPEKRGSHFGSPLKVRICNPRCGRF